MKKTTLILLLVFCLISFTSFAQNRFGGQNILGASGGITGKSGYFADINYNRLIGNNFWGIRGDIIYANQNAKINDIPNDPEVKLKHYLFLAGVTYSFEDIFRSFPFYIHIIGQGALGYENINNSNKELPNSGLIVNKLKNKMVYGFNLGMEAEMPLWRDISINLNGSQLYRANSNAGNFTYYIGAGVKFYLN